MRTLQTASAWVRACLPVPNRPTSLASGALHDPDAQVRLMALLALADRPATAKAGEAVAAALCETEVEPVPRPEMAAEDKDIVITATTSREPVLNGHWIAEGTHINAAGSNFLGKAELDAVAVRRCDSIVVDSKDQARLEAGDFVQPLEEGSIHWADIHELGQVIVGRYTGRAHAQDVTLFKSLGIGLEDLAVAARVYVKAQAAGLGKVLEW